MKSPNTSVYVPVCNIFSVFVSFFCCFCKAYPLPNAHCLVLVNTCADEEETEFVKEYIKDNNIYIKLGISFVLLVHVTFCICILSCSLSTGKTGGVLLHCSYILLFVSFHIQVVSPRIAVIVFFIYNYCTAMDCRRLYYPYHHRHTVYK